MKESVAARLAAHKAGNQQQPLPLGQPKKKKAKTYNLDMHAAGGPVPSSSSMSLGAAVGQPVIKAPPAAPSNPYLAHKQEVEVNNDADLVDDEPIRAAKPRQQAKSFRFVAPGHHSAKAEQQRERDAAAAVFLSGRKQGHTIVTAPIAGSAEQSTANHHHPNANPDTKMPLVMEWWDLNLLPADLKKEVVEVESKALVQHSKASLKSVDGESSKEDELEKVHHQMDDLRARCRTSASLSNSKTSSLVQHIVPIKPPGVSNQKKPVLHLTRKEEKRRRKLRRREQQQKLQDLQAAGLIPAPEPRLTLSNFIQVLGDQAYLDPSQMEAKVQAQVQARQKAHLERNASNKLTKEQRAEKVARKYTATDEIVTAIFRVENASHPYHRAKIDLNAQQLQLTGVLVECGVASVIVEGNAKAIQKFSRLMLVRMKWNGPDEEEDEEGIETSTQPFPQNNACSEIWTGTANKRIFKGFYFHSCETYDQARKLLKSKGVEHYWSQTVSKTDGLKIKLVDNKEEVEDMDMYEVSRKEEDIVMRDA